MSLICKPAGLLLACALGPLCTQLAQAASTPLSYPIVDTGVTEFYSNSSRIKAPRPGAPFFGQDAQYRINPPSYRDNGDGTISDRVTGLMWQKNMGEKMTLAEARAKVKRLNLGGHNDWRIPSIKELYSLIQFTGRIQRQQPVTPYIDTRYFDQPEGDTRAGERAIDAQTWSATEYAGRTMRNDRTLFGVNFIDGRIKGYSMYKARRDGNANRMYFRFVRGNPEYGKNRFVDNGDGSISDLATGLMWQQGDSRRGMDWQDALGYANDLELAGHSDWRLPNAKELQSIVDYNRSPQQTRSAAIDPLFRVSTYSGPDGRLRYPYYWTSTTHLDGRNPYTSAVYIAFGEALGKMSAGGPQANGQRPQHPPRAEHRRPPQSEGRGAQHSNPSGGQLMDVHGAGAQRSDPKSGYAGDYPQYVGPQGDMRWLFNHVRAVRSIEPIKPPYKPAY